jgi:cell division protease FtsH
MKKHLRESRFAEAAMMNFPTAVAMCAVRSALRPFLRHPDAAFVGVLEIPTDIDSILYHHAASTLLDRGTLYDDFGNQLSYVVRLDETSIVTALQKILDAKRSVILIRDREALDTDLRLLADVEGVVGRPKPAHFLAAGRMLGLSEMTSEDAEYLAGLDFQKVRLAIRSGRSFRTAMNRLRRSARLEEASVHNTDEQKTEPPLSRTLHQTAGYGEAAEWGLQLAKDIAGWMAGEIEWEDVDRGAVLYGKPGCGKTTYGRILAATCGLSIIEASSASWQATGHLGDMLKAMRKTFEVARKKAPCILFLDEFDAFGDRSSDTAGDNIDYKRQVINALLECLDPPEGRPGVVVVAATNFPHLLDPALLRPGRLERLIGIPLPDGHARIEILRQHLRGVAPPDDLGNFVEMSAGFSGADLELLARAVRRVARQGNRPLTERDLLDALPQSRELSTEELRQVAIHEAGHAVVCAALLPDELHRVHLRKRVSMQEPYQPIGLVEFARAHSISETEDSLSRQIDVQLGGLAAERVIIGQHSTSTGGSEASDLRLATDLATKIERYFGFGDTLVIDLGMGRNALERMRATDPRLWRAVDRRLKSSLGRTEAIVAERRMEVEKVAEWLIARGTVEGAEVRDLVRPRHVTPTPVPSVAPDQGGRPTTLGQGLREMLR